jgi:hypothetical protein
MLTAIAAVALLLTACTAATSPGKPASRNPASTVGTLYTPPASAPKPGALYARAVQLRQPGASKGDLLATFEQYTAGMPVFPIYRSTDDGRNWSKFSKIRDTQNGWGLRYQPTLYELPSAVGSLAAGTVLAFGNSIPNDLSKTQLDAYASSDAGKTWRFVSSIASGGKAIPNNGETPVWEPFALVADGKLIVYYSDQRDPKHGQKLVHETSADGIHWSAPVDDVAVANYSARPGMPVVAHMGNGQWAMTYEYGGAPEGDFAAYLKVANDPEHFGSAPGMVIDANGLTPTSSPYVVWANTGGKGKLIVSTGGSPLLFVSRNYGASGSWKARPTKIPQGYTRSMVVLAGNSRLLGISAGAIGAEHNTVRFATVSIAGL